MMEPDERIEKLKDLLKRWIEIPDESAYQRFCEELDKI